MRREDVFPGTERSFGLSVGGVLAVIAALLIWRDRPLRGEVLGSIGTVLMLSGLLWPALAKASAKPEIWRLIGTDPLATRRKPAGGWRPYPDRYRDRNHYQRMY